MGKELETRFDGFKDEVVAGGIGVEAVGKEAIEILMGKDGQKIDEGYFFFGSDVLENVSVFLDTIVGVVKFVFKWRGFGFDDRLGTDEDHFGGEFLGKGDEFGDVFFVLFF